MKKSLLLLAAALVLTMGCQLKKKQSFEFQPRAGLTVRCTVKGVRNTAYEGAPSVILNYDLEFEKTGTDTAWFMVDSLRVSCNGKVSTRTSCRTASVAVMSRREFVPPGKCTYPLYSVFPEGSQLKPVTEFKIDNDGLFDDPY